MKEKKMICWRCKKEFDKVNDSLKVIKFNNHEFCSRICADAEIKYWKELNKKEIQSDLYVY